MKCKKCKKVLGRYANGPLCRKCRAPKTTAAALKRKEEGKKRRLAKRSTCTKCGAAISIEAKSRMCRPCREQYRQDKKKSCGTPGCTNKCSKEADICRECYLERKPNPEFGRILLVPPERRRDADPDV